MRAPINTQNAEFLDIGVLAGHTLHSPVAKQAIESKFSDLSATERGAKTAWFSIRFTRIAAEAGVELRELLDSNPPAITNQEICSLVLHAHSSKNGLAENSASAILIKISNLVGQSQEKLWEIARMTVAQSLCLTHKVKNHSTQKVSSLIEVPSGYFKPTVMCPIEHLNVGRHLGKALESFVSTDNIAQASNIASIILSYFNPRERGALAVMALCDQLSFGDAISIFRGSKRDAAALRLATRNLGILNENDEALSPDVRFALLANLCRELKKIPPEISSQMSEIRSQAN